MVFQDKLAFLMEITSTSNKKLAEAIKVDASLISRLRSGERHVPQNAEYLNVMAFFFASRCKSKYQLEALSELIGRTDIPRTVDENMIAEIISTWLSSNSTVAQSQADLFLRAFDQMDDYAFECSVTKVTEKNNLPKKGESYSYHGNEGKRLANIMFEEMVLASNYIGEIKILTEGNTEWIWSDNEYANEVSSNIRKALLRGNIITRIVPRMRNLAMAFDTVTRWLPLYMVGRVDSYYYPHIRDGIFQRTLYVAPGIAAMVSTTVGERTECGTTFLMTDPFTVASFDREFMDYLALCRPATTLYDEQNSPLKLRKCMNNYFEHQSNCIAILTGLSSISIPPKLFTEASEKFDVDELRQNYDFCFTNFEKLVKQYYYIEVFPVEEFDDIIAGKVRCFALDLRGKPAFYSAEEYRLHLLNIVKMLYKYPNYHVVLSKGSDLDSNAFIKQNYKVVLIKTIPKLTVCETEYADMVSAVWEYALSKTQTGTTKTANRIETVSRLKQLIRQLSDYTNCYDEL